VFVLCRQNRNEGLTPRPGSPTERLTDSLLQNCESGGAQIVIIVNPRERHTDELQHCNWNTLYNNIIYDGVSRSFRTGRLERELQIAKLPATRCSCIAILWVSLVSSATITLSTSVYYCKCIFRYHSARKLLDTPSYNNIYDTVSSKAIEIKLLRVWNKMYSLQTQYGISGQYLGLLQSFPPPTLSYDKSP
jgi:hypothetical protein